MLWLGEKRSAGSRPADGIGLHLRQCPSNDFAPGRDYYAILHRWRRSPEEHPGRRYTNQDFIGFSLDASGAVRLRCRSPVSGNATAGVRAIHWSSEQWHLVNSGQAAFAAQPGVPGEDLAMQGALQDGPTGRGVRVAVVDTGLEICHPDLTANIEAGASHNFNVGPWTGASNRDPYPALIHGRPRHLGCRRGCCGGQQWNRRPGGGAKRQVAGLQHAFGQ